MIFTDTYSYPGVSIMIPLLITNYFKKHPMQNITIDYNNLILETMPDLKVKQLQYETNSGKRLLGFMMEENIHHKNRLSEILKEKFDKYLLEEVDNFQSRFIKGDELIGLLRNEIAEMDKLLAKEISFNEKYKIEIHRKLKKLQHNITSAEKEFRKLKSEFNNFLSLNIL
jgi:hypothetical protein